MCVTFQLRLHMYMYHKWDVWITSPINTLYNVVIDKILLIKPNVVSMRGPQFCDDVVFHLNTT